MATSSTTPFASGDPSTRKHWAEETFYETLAATYCSSVMGEGQENVVQVLTDLSQNRGDQIRFDLMVDIGAEGVYGDNNLEDNLQNLTYHQDAVNIDLIRQGVLVQTMSQQRTVHDLRYDGQRKLVDWWAKRYDIWLFAALAGTAGANADGTTNAGYPAIAAHFAANGPNAFAAPDADHRVGDGSAAFTLEMLDQAVEKAQTLGMDGIPMVRPIMVGGVPYYVCFMHPFVWTNVKKAVNTASVAGWNSIQQNAGVRGWDNPIFTGAVGMYNNVIIKVTSFVPMDLTTATPVAHTLFCGAQAAVIAFGNAFEDLGTAHYGSEQGLFTWFEQTRDGGNRREIMGGSILGIKKVQFGPDSGSQKDFGVIRIDTNDTKNT